MGREEPVHQGQKNYISSLFSSSSHDFCISYSSSSVSGSEAVASCSAGSFCSRRRVKLGVRMSHCTQELDLGKKVV